MAYLLCLDQCESLEEFIHRAKTTREDDKCLRIFDEHGLPYKKVVEVERNVEVGVRALLKGQFDITANRNILAFLSTLISSLHDSRASTGDNAKSRLSKQTRCFYCCPVS